LLIRWFDGLAKLVRGFVAGYRGLANPVLGSVAGIRGLAKLVPGFTNLAPNFLDGCHGLAILVSV
jgi:hypothetical protein